MRNFIGQLTEVIQKDFLTSCNCFTSQETTNDETESKQGDSNFSSVKEGPNHAQCSSFVTSNYGKDLFFI